MIVTALRLSREDNDRGLKLDRTMKELRWCSARTATPRIHRLRFSSDQGR